MKLTAERLRELLNYDTETGLLTRQTANNKGPAGEVIGSLNRQGYQRIRIDGKTYRSHRLAWLWMTGKWPSEIDHINMDKADNSWRNLREVTGSQNRANRTVRKDNKSKYKGVHFFCGRYSTEISKRRVGRFYNKTDAAICYNYHAVHLFGEYSRINQIDQTDYIHE